MRRLVITFVAIAAAAIVIGPATAQQKRVSPHETIYTRVGGGLVSITYGRPYTKDPKSGEMRKIWGGLVPWGKAWRTGSDEATTLILQNATKIGEAEVPAGAYTLYTIPMETGESKLAISKKIGYWGIPVDEKQDLVRVDSKKDAIEKSVDQFTMAFDKGTDKGTAVLKMSWETTQFSVTLSPAKK